LGFAPWQAPPAWHVSVCVHALSSLQGVPAAANTFAGQVFEEPLQVSATSHAPTDARHKAPGERGPQSPSCVAPAATLHAWQSVVFVPPHALLQQTPSTQKSVSQSAFTEHAWPTDAPRKT
jgi:hypothetical protein